MTSVKTISALCEVFQESQIIGKSDMLIKKLSLNSNEANQESAFIAMPGAMVDGRNFIKQAVEAGAKAIFVEQNNLTDEQNTLIGKLSLPIVFVKNLRQQLGLLAAKIEGNPSEQLEIVGVTGTNGKTSICQMSAEIIDRLIGSCAQMGTLGIGLVNQLQASVNTTADPLTLHAYFKKFVNAKIKHVAMEVSSHALAQNRINGIYFKVAVFTNLTREHLDFHPNMDNYFEEKRKLFLDPKLEYAIINVNDEYGKRLINDPQIKAKKIAYGLNVNPDDLKNIWGSVVASEINNSQQGQRFFVKTPWGEQHINFPLLAEFNLSNGLAVIAVLNCLGLNWEDVIKELSEQKSIPGRMERFEGKGRPTVIVDFAHTPDALERALKSLRAHCRGDIWCVFGCGGDRDPGKRPLMAQVAESNCEHLIITDDNPRNEDGNIIISDILSGLTLAGEAIVERDRSVAIKMAIDKASVSDIILVAGKGHESFQLIKGTKFNFSDRDYVKQQLMEQAS